MCMLPQHRDKKLYRTQIRQPAERQLPALRPAFLFVTYGCCYLFGTLSPNKRLMYFILLIISS